MSDTFLSWNSINKRNTLRKHDTPRLLMRYTIPAAQRLSLNTGFYDGFYDASFCDFAYCVPGRHCNQNGCHEQKHP